MIYFLAVLVFVLGYFFISTEHKFHTNKSAIALLMGGALWVLVAVQGSAHFQEAIHESASEIFDIVIFLLAAMSLVEVLVHYQFFDVLRGKIFALGLDEKKQYLVLSALSFFLSGVIDNLTTTIVMIQIARKFFRKDNLVIAVAGIVIAANAGGAFSPLGDVTTIMLWLADKFTAWEIIKDGFLASFTIFAVANYFIYRQIKPSKYDAKSEIITELTRSEKLVIGLVFGSFSLPMIMSRLELPPYLGLLLGLGFVWLVIDVLKQYSPRVTHLEASIEHLMQKTDIASLKFFVGILLAVSALDKLGILEYISHFIYGEHPAVNRIILGNVVLGAVSSILDNVPLTAITIEILQTEMTSLWVLLAITVGTGGSLLIVGSAAGVIAMGMVKELNFARYIKIAFVPAAVGYLAGVGVWMIENMLILK